MPVVPIAPLTASGDQTAAAEMAGRLPPARQRVRPSAMAVGADTNAPKAANGDYVVGYGRPPVQTRFKPGKSGNPRGRPKGAKGLNSIARELLTAKVPVRTASGEKKIQRIEAVLHKAFELALKGNSRAVSQVLSLYASAVPNEDVKESAATLEELTSADVAILEELKRMLLQEGSE